MVTDPRAPALVVVMGVSGAGKTTVGRALAERWGVEFVEGDRLHPPANVERMAAGLPLTDEDRVPWLEAVAATIAEQSVAGHGAVISCSALRRRYRERLREAGPIRFVFLDPDRDELERRLANRDHEFMSSGLLGSQLDTLEVPIEEADVVIVEPAERLEDTVDRVIDALAAST